MDQKRSINVVVIVLIVLLVGTAGYLTFQKWPASTLPGSTNVANNVFSTNIDGYFETCVDSTIMYKLENGLWEKVSNALPKKGLYYLDDKFVGYGMCDVVVCSELSKPYTVNLVEYKKVGEKTPPPDSGSTANVLPVYQTAPLSGDIKIDIQYFSDKKCQSQKTFSTVLKR